MPICVAFNAFLPLSFFYSICLGKTMCVTPNAPVHELQCCVLHEINQLKKP
jgi:hypothetical protein